MKKYLLFILIVLSPILAQASDDCGLVSVKNLVVEADRENGSAWANTMHIQITGSSCSGIDYAYLKNDRPAYAGILSLLLSAQASGRDVQVIVRDAQGLGANSREIEYVIIP